MGLKVLNSKREKGQTSPILAVDVEAFMLFVF